MIELALKGGGPDNVTVIVADVADIDFGEDAPIVGGAAGDGSDDSPPPDSAASRASAITAPRPVPQRTEPPAEAPDPKSKRWGRIKAALLVIFLLLLVAGAGFATRWWVLRQYYVGATDNGQVSIFRGVSGSILGFNLHTVAEGSCPPGSQGCEPISVNDLKAAYRDVVKNGITDLNGLEDARRAIRALRTEQLLPLCSNPSTTSPAPSTTSVAPTTTVVAASSSALPPIPGDQPSTTPSTQDVTQLPSSAQQPGVDCRKGQ
jgi:protein phosphatase